MSNITMTNTDPGEGSALPADNFLAVYGGKTLLDLFYPVGSYYETSNSTFDPNVSWGGVWVEDSKGRVVVAQADSGTFSTIGATGGVEKNDFSGTLHYADGAYGLQQNSSAYSDRQITGISGKIGGGEQVYHPFSNLNNLQPYVVARRWHRTA